jgi:hypothetical protein
VARWKRRESRGARRMTPALEVTNLNKRFGGLPATREFRSP